jgi:antitoxin FitA
MSQESAAGSLTIREFDDALKQRLQARTARNGRSVEEEAKPILASELVEPEALQGNIADGITVRIVAIVSTWRFVIEASCCLRPAVVSMGRR